MGAHVAAWWSAVWPNLAANVLWVPLAWIHHRLMKHHTAQQIADHAERQRQALTDHITTVLGAAPTATEEA